MASKLTDNIFTKGHRYQFPRRLTEQQKAALKGIASEQSFALEKAAVFLGAGNVDDAMGREAHNPEAWGGPYFCTLCSVFVTPRNGKCPFCESEHIIEQTEKPKPMRGASVVKYAGSLRPISAPVKLDADTLQIKIGYNRSYGSPSTDDLMAYIAHRHPGYRIADGEDRGAGVTTLVIRTAADEEHKIDEVELPVLDHADVPEGMRRKSPAPYEGTVYGEAVEGTGKIGQALPELGAQPPVDGAAPGLVMDPADEAALADMPEEQMSLEEAIELAPEVINTIVDKIEQGETLLHGEEVEPVEDGGGEMTPGAPGAATAPLQEGAVPVSAARRLAVELQLIKAFVENGDGLFPNVKVALDMEGMDISTMIETAKQIAGSDLNMARLLDRISVQYLIKSNDILRKLSEEDQTKILVYAIRQNPRIVKRIMNIAKRYKGDVNAPAEEEVENEGLPAAAPGKAESLEQEEHVALTMKQAFDQPGKTIRPDHAVKLKHHQDRARDRSILTNAPHIPFYLDKTWQSGKYTFFRITWDVDSWEAQRQTPQALVQALKSFVQRCNSERHFKDFGWPGRMHMELLDQEAGVAEVFFRTVKPGDSPDTFREVE